MEMIDNRKALPIKYKLVNNSIEFLITDEVGRGSNCIVYNATYFDSEGMDHIVRLKEFYPIYINLIRNEEYEIRCNESHIDKFEEEKKRFETTYETNVEFRNTYGVMNSTVNATDKFIANGTIYVVMNLDEGEDYRNYKDVSLTETLIHVKALASVIEKYHRDGYLHLDIKPENVFVIPETAEHVYLFDFDSVCRITDLQSKKIFDLSYSEGFSAPEQAQGNITKIGVRTDIYAIGALLFYKFFDRKPTFEEGRYSASFDFKEMCFYDERLRPAFFKNLEDFFHKTLATSTILRWDSLKKAIDSLEELIKLSDLDKTYLIDTFTYNSAYFVGRTEEIEKIHDEIQSNNVLFISGIGGIGKTEIAKKYIAEYREDYDTVAFMYFQESIEHTVCKEILINNMSIDEEEKESDYFERVLDALRKSTTDNDLILLDNFDVERDDGLEELLKCPCKFLVTTRNRNIRDWNYNEVKIDRMNNEEDLHLLFETYNNEVYKKVEDKAIRDVINFVDGHTMTVELISKYLRDSGQQPSVLYQKFREKSGVINTDDRLIVNQRKDHRMNSESVNVHLSILFDVFNFDDLSKEVVSSLSLFSGIRINRGKFERIWDIDNVSNYIEKLINSGWIEYNEFTRKISLHQVIQDLIYTKLKPTTETCPNISYGMYKYIKKTTEHYSERRTKQKVFDIFTERISGKDILYANLCLEYKQNSKLNEAIRICKSIANEEAYAVLVELYMEKIRLLSQCEDMFESDDLSLDEYCQNQAVKIDNKFELAIEACKKAYFENQEKEFVELVQLAGRMDSIMSDLMMNGCFDDVEEIDTIYQKIMKLFEIVDEDILEYSITYEKKEKILVTVRDFYSNGDFCAMYRGEHYSDLEKVDYYQKLLDILRREKEELKDEFGATVYILSGDISHSDLGNEYISIGDYNSAIKMFKKVYEEDEEPIDWVLPRLAEAYYKVGKVDSAINCLCGVIDYDKRCIEDEAIIGHYSGYVCLELIKIFIEEERYVEARDYAKELIKYQEPEIQKKGDNSIYISDLLAAYWYLYYLADDKFDKTIYWNKCIDLFQQLRGASFQEEHIGFVREYIFNNELSFDIIMDICNRFELCYGNEEKRICLLEDIIKVNCEKDGFIPYRIQLLIKCAEITCDFYYKGLKKPLDYCRSAEELISQLECNRDYYRNKILKVKAEAMSNDNSYNFDEVNDVRKQCDYYLIAKYESQNMDYEKKIEIWKDSAEKYGYIDDYRNQIRCLEQACAIIVPILNKYEYSRFDSDLWFILHDKVVAMINLSNNEKAYNVIRDMFLKTLEYYPAKEDEKSEFLYKVKEIADLYNRANNRQAALKGYLIWMYIVLLNQYDCRILTDYLLDKHDMEFVIKEIIGTISESMVEEVDSLIDFKEKIERLNIDGQDLMMIQPILDIIKDYQNKDIEFK